LSRIAPLCKSISLSVILNELLKFRQGSQKLDRDLRVEHQAQIRSLPTVAATLLTPYNYNIKDKNKKLLASSPELTEPYMKRKPKSYNDRFNPDPLRGDEDSDSFGGQSRRQPQSGKPSFVNYTSLGILAAVFILGIGIGIAFSSTATISPENVASREFIDRSAPNPELCVQFGASAMVTDMRLYVTLNPFNVYISQPSMRPGCVLRTNNWAILEQRKLINQNQVRECKNRMNTFGFTGPLEGQPEINCIYQNDGAKNLFLNQPGSTAPATESQNF
jgi:Protein of unknown function (DUF3172)